MGESIKKQIAELEKELNEKITSLQGIYFSQINKLKQQHKQEQDRLNQQAFEQLEEVNVKTEFNDWWNLWLRLYEKVYRNINGKYYFVENSEVKEIKIINNFAGDINNIVYLKNVKHKDQITYLYIDKQTLQTYIYVGSTWEHY